MLDTGYVADGVKNLWFDASEPESLTNFNEFGLHLDNPLGQPSGSLFTAGSNQQVRMMFPWYHTKMVYDGLKAKFPDEVPVTLARSGWAGTQIRCVQLEWRSRGQLACPSIYHCGWARVVDS